MSERAFLSENELRKVFGVMAQDQGFEFQPIETGMTGCGIPDAYIAGHNEKGWIEFKLLGSVYTEPPLFKVPFQGGQFSWLTRYSRRGSTSWLILCFKEGLVVARDSAISKSYLTTDLIERMTPLYKTSPIIDILNRRW